MPSIYWELWYFIHPLLQRIKWKRVCSDVLRPCLMLALLASYCALLYLLQDDGTLLRLRQGITLRYFSGNLSSGSVVREEDVLARVEQVLDGLYQGHGLYWGNILEVPALRQVRAKQVSCQVSYAPELSCQASHTSPDQVNRSCFRCWTSLMANSHICAVANPGSSEEGACPLGCEHGFGYCPALGDATLSEGRPYPGGGHGLHLWLDGQREWEETLQRLADQGWLDRHSRHVSLSFTVLEGRTNLVRIRLHLTRLISGWWSLSHDLSIAKIRNYFPDMYGDIPKKSSISSECSKIHHVITDWSRSRAAMLPLQYLLLILPAVLLLLTLAETPHLLNLLH